MLSEPTAVFVYLAALLAGIFWLSGLPRLQALFRITPAVLYAYFLPALSTSLGITPRASAAYDWMLRYLLPLSLALLMLTVDLPAVMRLGTRALLMMLAGSLGIILGGPIALALLGAFLPADTWMGLAALSGSWIGGAPNMVAIKESVGTPDSLMGPIIVVDTVVAYGWMGILLFLSSWQARIDRWLHADGRDVSVLDERLAAAETECRPQELRHLSILLGLGFGAAALSVWVGDQLPLLGTPTIVSHTTWAVILVTAAGVAFSFTPLRRLERVGASRVGYLALYLMLTAIGAQANLAKVVEAPLYLVVGMLWLGVHIAVLFAAARLLRAPLFFVATASMANVGGVVSAPVVASVYRPSLAPVGVLLGVAGYLIGIYGALVCAWLLSVVAGLLGVLA